MKNNFLLLLLFLVLVSCGATKSVSKRVMKGYWTLDTITYSESGKFNVTLFNDASTDCFTNSTWRFIPNNNTGIYTLTGSDCNASEDRHFVFTIDEVDKESGLYDFLLKPTNAKHKSETNHGFRVKLAQLSETSMQWQQTVSLEGKPFTIYMNFSKINE
ncbi:lipocalin family protein [Mangrovimonas spongiae]|uniref:Lipocalin n=1 Tax=Mangrovimonas spongiae TaxID=2494697 RepID=A0A428JWV7_9FLAO|nr:lipocalin family protein [Mangrovimonas spongiae]RSK38610.1 lipocalin [Mangrovimonas spongiae]